MVTGARPTSRSGAALAGPVAVGIAAAAALALVAAVDPKVPGHYPTCPFLSLTGWYCPGCGSLRGLHALAHGRLGEVVDHNALLVLVALPMVAGGWARWLWRSAGHRGRRRSRPTPVAAIRALLGVVLAFWLVRNLPLGVALAP